MIGLHGVYVPRRVKTPSVTAMTASIRTATGRRDQCFSPSPATQRQQQHGADGDDRRDEHDRRFQAGWQVGEDRVDPEEGEVGFRRGLDDGGVGLAGGTEGAEDQIAHAMTASMIAAAKMASFQAASGTKGMPVFFVELMIFASVGFLADEAARHRPVVDAEAQHHPDVQADAARAGCRE